MTRIFYWTHQIAKQLSDKHDCFLASHLASLCTLYIFFLLIIPQLFYLFFSHPLAYTNPSNEKDTMLQVTSLCMPCLSISCAVYGYCITQQPHHYFNNHSHHVKLLLV